MRSVTLFGSVLEEVRVQSRRGAFSHVVVVRRLLEGLRERQNLDWLVTAEFIFHGMPDSLENGMKAWR
jgi:hypothetical protein